MVKKLLGKKIGKITRDTVLYFFHIVGLVTENKKTKKKKKKKRNKEKLQ